MKTNKTGNNKNNNIIWHIITYHRELYNRLRELFHRDNIVKHNYITVKYRSQLYHR